MSAAATKPAPVQAPAPPVQRPALPGVLPLADLRPSPTNPRKTFPEAGLRALADSIAAVGVRQRLLVRPRAQEGHPAPRFDDATRQWVGIDHFEVVAGERRRRAALMAGLERVPVDVCDLSDEEVLVIQLVENDQREDVLPSEQSAAYRRLADAGRTAEQISADTGKPVGFVRGLLRLGRLPAWALSAVDAGTLPRATAELVARVPGDGARKRAAACTLRGIAHPPSADVDDAVAALDALIPDRNPEPPLSYRDAKDLIANHFQVQLKGTPFSRTALDLVPSAGSCEACPKRAGNDAEATAEGARADVCLDPECYRAKVAAHRTAEVAKAAEKGIEEADLGVATFPGRPPKGWIDVSVKLGECPDKLWDKLAGNQHDTKLKDALKGAAIKRYIAFGPGGKAVTLVRTADARKVLIEAKVLPRPESRPKAERSAAATARANGSAPKPVGPSSHEVDQEAAVIGAKVIRERVAEECKDLEDYGENSQVHTCLQFACRAVCYEWSRTREGEKLLREWVAPDGDFDKALDIAIAAMSASQALGLLLAVTAWWETNDGPNRATGRDLLAFAELDWDQLQEQARRELTGGEPAEEKIAKAEAAEPPVELAPELAAEIKRVTAIAHKNHKEVYLGDMDGGPMPESLAVPPCLTDLALFPAAVADALLPLGVTTLPTLLERVTAEVEIDLPLRNKVVTWLVKQGVKLKPAERAADAAAQHASGEPTPKKAPKKGARA